MPTIGEALQEARAALKQALTLDGREAGLEAHILLGHALQQSRAHLIAYGDTPLLEEQATQFHALLARRLHGEPIAYVLGEREFFGLPLQVTPDVLIPRPDTELLVELALALIPEQAEWELLDLGTGSGAVALAIAKHRPLSRVTAIDQSAAALAVAEANAERLRIPNIRFLQGDWYAPLNADEHFDLIVSNPPYIAESDPHLKQGDLRFEPQTALASGADGLDALRTIVTQAPSRLKPGCRVLLEHGFDQGPACRHLLQSAGFEQISSQQDLSGLERVSQGRLKQPH